jgi:hypothetical protein
VGGQRLSGTGGAILDPLEHPEELAHPAHQQALFVDLDPGAGGGWEDDMIAGFDRHRDADVIPPIEARPNGEHDPVLRRRLVGSRRYEQAGAPDAVRVELLDHDPVEDGAKLVAHRL